MGLLDGVLGNVLGGMLGGAQQGGSPLDSILGRLGGSSGAQAGAGGALMTLALQFLQQNGGIGGVVERMREAGLGAHADSWVGTGANLPVSADQLHQALGAGGLAQIAGKLGLSPEQASGGLAQLLPELVNHMTPNGSIPDDQHDMISSALAALAPKRDA